ncbi:MAG TPA: hypothetical protein VGI39_37445 [Polyangiaceae bacterium]
MDLTAATKENAAPMSHLRILSLAILAALGLAACGGSPGTPTPRSDLYVVAADSLCVTEGTVSASGDTLQVSDAKMRAIAAFQGDPVGELRFTYQAPTAQVALQSGLVVSQAVLKLEAQDDCNLVYVRWLISPKNAISVEVKSNPGMQASAECGDSGYQEVKASTSSSDVAAVTPGTSHVLHAERIGDEIYVWADGELAWVGTLPEYARSLRGPTGVRSDNVALSFELLAPAASSAEAAANCP